MYDNELYVSDPGRVKTQASTITTAANTFDGIWNSTKGTFGPLHTSATWGNDSIGQAFLQGYGDPTNASFTNDKGEKMGGDDSPAAKVIAGTTDVAGRLIQIGPTITNLMNGIIDDDELIATWFKGEE